MNLNLAGALLLFGMFQCVLMMILIITNRRWKTYQNLTLLSLLCILLASLTPSFLGNSELVLKYDFLRFIPLHMTLFVFPILYLYVKSIFSHTRQNKEALQHITTPVIFWLYFFFIWLQTLTVDSSVKGVLAKELGYFSVQALHDGLLLLFGIGYSIACTFVISKASKEGLFKEQQRFLNWTKWLVTLLGFGVFLEMSSVLLGNIYGYWQSSPVDEWLGFSFTLTVKVYNAIILYGVSLIAYTSYSSFKSKSKFVLKNEKDLLQQLQTKMEDEKKYLDTTLTLQKCASKLGITSVVLSGLLNDRMGISFNDFINTYRVQEVIRLVKEGKNDHLTFEAISEKAGFKSKTTFYRAFKKVTSKTPKAYFNLPLP